jgi:uncharacterized membrane protein
MVEKAWENSVIAALKTGDIIWISVVLAVILVVGIIAMVWAKRRFGTSDDFDRNSQIPFTLEQIRRLHQQGQISTEEYQSLKEQIIRENQPKSV